MANDDRTVEKGNLEASFLSSSIFVLKMFGRAKQYCHDEALSIFTIVINDDILCGARTK